jgi:hypothetical protein
MRSIKVKDLRFCPVYIPRNEKGEPLFYLEFLEPTYSLTNESFFNENTIMTIHSALDYSQSAVINDTHFDFDIFTELLRQDLHKYQYFIPKSERDDIPAFYYPEGKLMLDALRQHRFELREFLYRGQIKHYKQRIKLERILNIYLQHFGFKKFFRFLNFKPQIASPERYVFEWSNRLSVNQKHSILRNGNCYKHVFGNSHFYLVKSELLTACFIQSSYQ